MLFLVEVSGRLDLKSTVLDIEVIGQTTAQAFKDHFGLPHMRNRILDDDVGAHDRHP